MWSTEHRFISSRPTTTTPTFFPLFFGLPLPALGFPSSATSEECLHNRLLNYKCCRSRNWSLLIITLSLALIIFTFSLIFIGLNDRVVLWLAVCFLLHSSVRRAFGNVWKMSVAVVGISVAVFVFCDSWKYIQRVIERRALRNIQTPKQEIITIYSSSHKHEFNSLWLISVF